MADTLWGDVIRVVDGDTFDVRVMHYSRQNQFRYNTTERVRISWTDAPEIATVGWLTATQKLERRFGGKHVRLTVHTRDIYGRLVYDVNVVSKV